MNELSAYNANASSIAGDGTIYPLTPAASIASRRSTTGSPPIPGAKSQSNSLRVQRLQTAVECRRPSREEFIRIHPDKSFACICLLLKLKRSEVYYLMNPTLAEQLCQDPSYTSLVKCYTLYTAVSRSSDDVFLWPIRKHASGERPNGYVSSAIEAAERAKTNWLRITSNQSAQRYDAAAAEGQLTEPTWDVRPLEELFDTCFRDRVIDGVNHPILKELRGAS